MDVDTRLLRYFLAVAEEGSLTRAAERLFVSQPALTKQIRQLERLLGLPLFTRSRAGMALTEPGRALADGLPAMLADWDSVLRATTAAGRRASHVLRVGFVASAANEATPSGRNSTTPNDTLRGGAGLDIIRGGLGTSDFADPQAGGAVCTAVENEAVPC
jgi:molybdenum-dependent DNA-binding transcriptional regulator ModE